jgi:hypothetical protein
VGLGTAIALGVGAVVAGEVAVGAVVAVAASTTGEGRAVTADREVLAAVGVASGVTDGPPQAASASNSNKASARRWSRWIGFIYAGFSDALARQSTTATTFSAALVALPPIFLYDAGS